MYYVFWLLLLSPIKVIILKYYKYLKEAVRKIILTDKMFLVLTE